MKSLLTLFIFLLIPFLNFAHGFDELEELIESDGVKISGTLTLPAHAHGAMPIVIIIAGSGPTDRDCNGQGFKSDAYKKMAAQLALNGIASFRYDKRGVGKSVVGNMKEEDMRFENLVTDANAVISKYEKDSRFSKIAIAGHSEGSLVGMMCAKEQHKYISLAGISTTANEVLKEQLAGQLGDLEKSTFAKLDSIKNGTDVTCDNPMLMSLFRPSVLPYMKSWFKINPTAEIKKLKCPVLIINGSKDLQVPEKHAEALNKANPNSKLVMVPNMNHVLTEINSDTKDENLVSYNKPELPLSKKMMDEIILFVIK